MSLVYEKPYFYQRSHDEGEESEEKDLRPEDIIPDDDDRYASDDENLDQKFKDKPVGPPLEIEIPLHHPPGQPEKVQTHPLITVSPC